MPNPEQLSLDKAIAENTRPDTEDEIARRRMTNDELLEIMLKRVRDDAQRRRSKERADKRAFYNKGDRSVIEGQKVSETSITTRNSGCIGTYRKGKAEYYRFSYRENGKVKHKHLGPSKDPTVKKKVHQIQIALDQGNSIDAILKWYCRK